MRLIQIQYLKGGIWGAALAGVVALPLSITAFAASAGVDFTQYGFPQVVAKKSIAPTQSVTFTAQNMKFVIPAGTFPTAVTFEVLENKNSYWQSKAPKGQTVLSNFAFKVINSSNGTLVESFNKPVIFAVTNSAIVPKSQYYNITASGKWVVNPIPAKIVGDTLSHPIKGAPVGWAVTSPAASTTPTTGLPLAPVMATGVVMVGLGSWILMRRKTVS